MSDCCWGTLHNTNWVTEQKSCIYKPVCTMAAVCFILFFFVKCENFPTNWRWKSTNITSWLSALHPHCIRVNFRAADETLVSSSSSLLLCTIKRSHWLGFCWQECVTKCVRACCLIILAITTGNDQPFALKSQQKFSLFLLSLETQGDRPAPVLHCWCSAAPHSEPCHRTAVRMQNKRLLA